jgi:hypothetical protein
LHRLPESIAQIAEALWMQALEEGKRRATLEQRDNARVAELDKQRLELRSHVLTLREGELDSRLRDRDRTIEELDLRLRELAGALRKEQATRELLMQEITDSPFVRMQRRKPRAPAQAKKRKAGQTERITRKPAVRKRAKKRSSKAAGRNRKRRG